MKISSSQAKKALAILNNIYKQPPEFEDNAEKIIRALKKWGLLLGLVTHANTEWTLFKLSSLGLDGFFDHVQIVDESRPHKNSGDWQSAAEKIQRLPRQLLAVGDNKNGDAIAALNAGFGQVIWIHKQMGWTFAQEGELPQGIHTIHSIGELLTIHDD